ncbi:MAG: zf-HC2 domain-containing protein [Oscillibacter sp.]|jgi:hypothetical protein|nr:zf-HC2 domain-containing protein [Oscillibacter sp.]
MKYCEEYAALLDAFVDGECTAEEAAKVRSHLQTCPGCQAYVNEILLMRDAFPDEDVDVPAGLADGVMAAIRSDAAPRKRTAGQWAKIWLPRVACLAVAVGIGIFWMAIGGAGNSAASTTASIADTASIEGYAASSEANTAGIPESALKSSSNIAESAPAGSDVEEASVQPALTSGTALDAGASSGGEFNGAGTYARWAWLPASQVGTALDGFEGAEKTDADTGEVYTLYELSEQDFDAVIAALNASDAVSADDQAATTLCAIAVYPD